MEQEIIPHKKKKWYRKKWFYVVAVVVLLIIVGTFKVKLGGNKIEYQTVKVEKGVLTQTVDATGNVKSANELDLRFETTGRIGYIYQTTGAEVQAGQPIVDLELGELNAQVAKASAVVAKAQANLDKLLAGNTGSYLTSLKASIDKAQANLDKIEAQYDDSIANTEAAVETAMISLELSAGGEDSQIVENAYDNMLALLHSVQNTLSTALTEADNILGIDNTLVNDDFENVLSANNPSKLPLAENKYRAARVAKNNADLAINSLSTASAHTEIDWGADTTEEALFVTKDLLYAVAVVLDNTRTIGNLTQTVLDAMKTDIQTVRTSVSTQYSNLINEKQSVQTAKDSYSTNLITYNNAVANLDNLQKEKVADVAAYQALVEQAQANYDDSYNPPRAEDLASYEAALAEARASLASAVASRNKARIIAPVVGVIGKIVGKVGEYVNASDVVVKLVSPHFEIKVDIPETDIIKLSLGDEATINLDAYGDEVEFVGKVTEIEKGETVIQDVVYYTVTVSMEEYGDREILNGMTADVMFYTEEKNDVLYIPLRALRTNGEGKYVKVLENGVEQEVNIKTGLRGDGGLVEILEGLEAGQEVVISTIE